MIDAQIKEMEFQSTPLMRGETDHQLPVVVQLAISIHSPHARGDIGAARVRRQFAISIHSPHARGDSSLVHRAASFVISIHSLD